MFTRPRYTEATAFARTVVINDRPVRVGWTRAADEMLTELVAPLYVEMQLYFSCLVKKQLLFHHTPPERIFVPVTEKLFVRFHPVTARACLPAEAEGGQPTLPIETSSVRKMTPSRLLLDFRAGRWQGEYRFTLKN